MPARPPPTTRIAVEALALLGQQIRAQRKALRVNATAAAEAAGISRVTLHRIEKGAPAVTMGAYLNVMAALGLTFGIIAPAATARVDAMKGWLPARIRLSDYPQLKQLAWQVQGTDELTPAEALSIYERNARHLDMAAMEAREQNLIDALRLALGDNGKHV
ncbi:MAG: helix-turn-helix domain-containing protein [Rhodocyclaceae bacterium]|jgi:transcriptional regulator with XRE-family HTH domain|nr:helix-turn-helix domain-containing protein [Rhodocyclaceae bacterium]